MRKLTLLWLMALSSIVLFAESEYTYNSTSRTYDYTGKPVSTLFIDFTSWTVADMPAILADDMALTEKNGFGFMKWKILESQNAGRKFGTCSVLFNDDNTDFPTGPKNNATTNPPRIYLPQTVGGITTLKMAAGAPADVPFTVYYMDSKHGVWTNGGTITVLKNKYQEYSLELNSEGQTVVYLETQSTSWPRIMQISADIEGGDVPVTGISLNLHEYDIQLNTTLTLTATIEPEDATDKTITWSSSDESILTVDGGVVTAKALGQATIYAQAGMKVDSCVLTVMESVIPATAITWNVPDKVLNMKMGDSTTVTYTITPANATRTSVILMSSDENYATISQEGKIHALGGGTVTITAVLDDLMDQFTLNITDPNKPVGELDWDQDGTYWGDSVNYVYANFNAWPLTALPMEYTEDIQQYTKLGFIRWKMKECPNMIGQQIWDNNDMRMCLYTDNPTIGGFTNVDSLHHAEIFLPTLKNGAGAIRIEGYVSMASSSGSSVQLSFYDRNYSETQAGYTFIKSVTIPSDGTNIVESDLSIEDPVTLQITWQRSPWMRLYSIQVSPYGYPLSDDPDKDFGDKDSAIDNVYSKPINALKMMVDGQFVIVSHGVQYNAQGMKLK